VCLAALYLLDPSQNIGWRSILCVLLPSKSLLERFLCERFRHILSRQLTMGFRDNPGERRRSSGNISTGTTNLSPVFEKPPNENGSAQAPKPAPKAHHAEPPSTRHGARERLSVIVPSQPTVAPAIKSPGSSTKGLTPSIFSPRFHRPWGRRRSDAGSTLSGRRGSGGGGYDEDFRFKTVSQAN
jgi:hypothetical protein